MATLTQSNGNLGGGYMMSDGRETVSLFSTAIQISMLPEGAILDKDLTGSPED